MWRKPPGLQSRESSRRFGFDRERVGTTADSADLAVLATLDVHHPGSGNGLFVFAPHGAAFDNPARECGDTAGGGAPRTGIYLR